MLSWHAMNMLLMAGVGPGDRVIVTGASGGVGTFLIQIAADLGADVAAIASADKHRLLADLGAHVVDRKGSDPVDAACVALGDPPTVAADVVGGDSFGALIDALAHGGRYVTAGAIAGPIVRLDLRTLYLNAPSSTDRPPTGATPSQRCSRSVPPTASHRSWRRSGASIKLSMPNSAFLAKNHVGSIVLSIPPAEVT